MFEHVGRAQLPTYFRAAYALLKPGGLFVNHGIVSAPEMSRGLLERARRALWREGKFIDRHVFPDGELVQLDSAIGHAERAGFETRDVESLREHYVLTLRRWIRRLEVREEAAIRVVGAQAYRTWRLYLAASARAFTTARIGIAQVLLAKPDRFGRVRLPLTRTDLYRASIPDSNRVAG
jgi:cyclopropane-fatty-acyl-phospholipid synthase